MKLPTAYLIYCGFFSHSTQISTVHCCYNPFIMYHHFFLLIQHYKIMCQGVTIRMVTDQQWNPLAFNIQQVLYTWC